MKKMIAGLANLLVVGMVVFGSSCGKNTAAAAAKGGGADKTPVSRMDTVSVRFSFPIVEAGQSPFYLAQDKGFYAAEKLNVKFELSSNELDSVTMLAAGQDDFAVLVGPETLLIARSKGQPLKAVAVLHRNSNFPCLIALKSTGTTRLDQLFGTKIGINSGNGATDVLRNLMHKAHIQYAEVDVGADYSQLIAGKLDAECGLSFMAGLELPAKGVEVNVINTSAYGITTHGYTIIATEKTVAGKSDQVMRFLRASLKGVKYAVEHPDEATDSLLKCDAKLDRALCLKRQNAINAVTSNSEKYPPGYMDKEMFQGTYDRMSEEKVIEKPFDASEAFTTQFIDAINPKAAVANK